MKETTTTATQNATSTPSKAKKAHIYKVSFHGREIVGRVTEVFENGDFAWRSHGTVSGISSVADIRPIAHAEIMAYLGK